MFTQSNISHVSLLLWTVSSAGHRLFSLFSLLLLDCAGSQSWQFSPYFHATLFHVQLILIQYKGDVLAKCLWTSTTPHGFTSHKTAGINLRNGMKNKNDKQLMFWKWLTWCHNFNKIWEYNSLLLKTYASIQILVYFPNISRTRKNLCHTRLCKCI
jgi:hypothetical protein